MGNSINTVKYLRDRYDIMQKYLICKGISRPYLSNLENGKVELSHEMAYRIAEKFNEVFREKNIDVRLVQEDLMNSGRLLNKLKLNEELAHFARLENIGIEEMRILEESYLIVESPYEYAKLNSLLGNYYHYKKSNSKSIQYLVKAFDAYLSKSLVEEGILLLSKIVIIYTDLKDYNSALAYDNFFYNELQEYHTQMEDRLMEKFHYNSALLHKKLGNYELALDRLDMLEVIGSRRDQRNDFANILRGNILLAQVKVDASEEILKLVLLNTTDRMARIYTLITLLEIDVERKDKASFVPKAHSLLSMLKDHTDEMSQYAFYLLTVLGLSYSIGAFDIIFNNLETAASIIKKAGKRGQLEELILLLNKLELEFAKEGFSSYNVNWSFSTVSTMKNQLMKVYFRF